MHGIIAEMVLLNAGGCMGIASRLPVRISFTRISAGTFGCMCGIVAYTGALLCWDLPTGRICGQPPLGKFTCVSVGHHPRCAMKPTGDIHCWLASTKTEEYVLQAPPGAAWNTVAAGYSYACGVMFTGMFRCWD